MSKQRKSTSKGSKTEPKNAAKTYPGDPGADASRKERLDWLRASADILAMAWLEACRRNAEAWRSRRAGEPYSNSGPALAAYAAAWNLAVEVANAVSDGIVKLPLDFERESISPHAARDNPAAAIKGWRRLALAAIGAQADEPKADAVQQAVVNNQVLNGEWSKPLTKARMMASLRVDSVKRFNAFATSQGIIQAGNRQTWRLRLDGLSGEQKRKLREC